MLCLFALAKAVLLCCDRNYPAKSGRRASQIEGKLRAHHRTHEPPLETCTHNDGKSKLSCFLLSACVLLESSKVSLIHFIYQHG